MHRAMRCALVQLLNGWFDREADEPCKGQGTLSLARVEGRGAPRLVRGRTRELSQRMRGQRRS